MKCRLCGSKMIVTHNTALESVTIRYLKCPSCGLLDQSIETFREAKPNFDSISGIGGEKKPHKPL